MTFYHSYSLDTSLCNPRLLSLGYSILVFCCGLFSRCGFSLQAPAMESIKRWLFLEIPESVVSAWLVCIHNIDSAQGEGCKFMGSMC